MKELRDLAEGYGRDPAEIDLAYWALWYPAPETRAKDSDERMLFTGGDDDVAGDIQALREIGVSMIMLGYASPTLEEQLDKMERFAAEVRPLAGG